MWKEDGISVDSTQKPFDHAEGDEPPNVEVCKMDRIFFHPFRDRQRGMEFGIVRGQGRKGNYISERNA